MTMKQQSSVLVVDNNLNDLEFFSSCLNSLSMNCICAKEGVRTIILAQLHKPSLIFLDTALNDLNSVQVVRYLKSNAETANIPIIGCIPARAQQDVNKLFISGICEYIRKPLDIAKVEATINRFLGWADFSA